VIAKRYDNGAGTIDIGAGTLSTPPTGTFVLATLRFRAKSSTQGQTTGVVFSLAAPRETVVKDEGDHNLLGASTDGTVRVNASAYDVYLPLVTHR
jgi:hypothetical protein